MPGTRLALVLIVRAEFPELLAIEGGLNAQLAPLGKPSHESVAVPVKPNVGTTVTVDVAENPAMTVPGNN